MESLQKVFAGYASRQATLEATKDNPFSNGIAWVQGELSPISEARIPLLDQGFLRGDLTYDVPAVWDGRFFRLDDHLTRLEASCKKLRLKLPRPREEIRRILLEMVGRSGIRDAYVELIVTRGVVGVRGAKLDDLVNNLYLLVQPYIWVMAPNVQLSGTAADADAVLARTVRRTPPGSMDPTVKNLQWGDFVRGIFEAGDRGARYPFLTDGDGNLTEGPGYNVVLVKDRVLYTPDRGVLEGVTRKTVTDVSRRNGLEVRVEVVPVEAVYRADEIFMCTTAGGIMPVVSLDGQPVGEGVLGPITRSIMDGYWALHYDPAYSFEIAYDGF